MAKVVRAKNGLLKALHETAHGFENLGLIDQRQMRKLDVLCLEPVPDFDTERMKSLRSK
jgi:putative transcriptional regulator